MLVMCIIELFCFDFSMIWLNFFGDVSCFLMMIVVVSCWLCLNGVLLIVLVVIVVFCMLIVVIMLLVLRLYLCNLFGLS